MKKINISHIYNIDLWSGNVCDQKDNERGWIFAPLNVARQYVAEKLSMKSQSFMLSSGYITFFDLLEKSASFLNAAETADENGLAELLSKSVKRTGDWEDFKRLAEKYGIVPLSAMPDAHCGHGEDYMLKLNNVLRYEVKNLRENKASMKEALSHITAVLCENLGTPPESFGFSYMDKESNICSVENITPLEFYNEFCPRLNDYEAVDVLSENTEEIKKAVAEQLKFGEQVVIGCDVLQQSNQMLGILDTDFNEPDNDMQKADRIYYQLIKPRHFMSIDGAELDENGNPVRFKVQDSHGADTGADGHYTMSASWFDEYVIKAVIKKTRG